VVLSIEQGINDWLTNSNLNNPTAMVLISVLLIMASVIILYKIGTPTIIALILITMEMVLFTMLGWIHVFILLVYGLVLFLVTFKVLGNGGITVDD